MSSTVNTERTERVMKRSQEPKKPTRRQKIAITNAGLKPENWKVAKDNGTSLELLSSGGRKREIPV